MSLRSVRHVIASAGIIGAAMLVFTGSALPVQAASPSVDFGTNGFVGRIINHDGQCLDMRSTATNAQLQVEPCNGSLQQEWNWVQVGSGGPYLLKNQRWGRCPTILNHLTGVGGKVTPTACNANDQFQQWDPGPPAPDGVEISDRADHGFVMHPAVCTTAIGAEIYMNAPNQCAVDFWHG